MAHYAQLDENNIVINVFVGRNEDEPPGNWEEYYQAKRTSYNTRCGVYYLPNETIPAEDQSKAFRKNYAGIGFTYDPVRDAFIPPKIFASWILNEETCVWDPPIPYPEDAITEMVWNEETLSWVPLQPSEFT